MDADEPAWPLIDDYFEAFVAGRRPETQRRYLRVRLRLLDFLDLDDMSAWLAPDEVTLLAAEREFDRDGALWRLMGLEGLIRVLPGLVHEDRLPTGATESRMQISVTKRLLLRFRHDRQMTREIFTHQQAALGAVDRARSDLEARLAGRPPIDWHGLSARFRQQPGPQW